MRGSSASSSNLAKRCDFLAGRKFGSAKKAIKASSAACASKRSSRDKHKCRPRPAARRSSISASVSATDMPFKRLPEWRPCTGSRSATSASLAGKSIAELVTPARSSARSVVSGGVSCITGCSRALELDQSTALVAGAHAASPIERGSMIGSQRMRSGAGNRAVRSPVHRTTAPVRNPACRRTD